jgi:hypothetical protein
VLALQSDSLVPTDSWWSLSTMDGLGWLNPIPSDEQLPATFCFMAGNKGRRISKRLLLPT